MSRQQTLLEILGDLNFFYAELNRLIVDYDTVKPWDPTPISSWDQGKDPTSIIPYQQHLYICHKNSDYVTTYNIKGENINENSSFYYPSGLDLDESKNLLYVAEKNEITILDLKSNVLRPSWKLPANNGSYRGLKIDNDVLYLTIEWLHQIFVCNSDDGKVKDTWGNVRLGNGEGEYNYPYGITTNNKYLYVCDSNNNRVQIVDKKKWKIF